MYVKKVSKHTALNPVARAVALAKLKDKVTTGLIKLYMLAPGEACGDLIHDISVTLSIIGYAAELNPKTDRDLSELRVLRGGLSACRQIMQTELWDPLQTVSIDQALNAGMRLVPILRAQDVNQACVVLFSDFRSTK